RVRRGHRAVAAQAPGASEGRNPRAGEVRRRFSARQDHRNLRRHRERPHEAHQSAREVVAVLWPAGRTLPRPSSHPRACNFCTPNDPTSGCSYYTARAGRRSLRYHARNPEPLPTPHVALTHFATDLPPHIPGTPHAVRLLTPRCIPSTRPL